MRLALTYLFGIKWCRWKLCPGGYIKNGDLICPYCERTIAKRKKEREKVKENLTQEEINESLSDHLILQAETHILGIMKTRQEKYPSERNSQEWADYTNFCLSKKESEVS